LIIQEATIEMRSILYMWISYYLTSNFIFLVTLWRSN